MIEQVFVIVHHQAGKILRDADQLALPDERLDGLGVKVFDCDHAAPLQVRPQRLQGAFGGVRTDAAVVEQHHIGRRARREIRCQALAVIALAGDVDQLNPGAWMPGFKGGCQLPVSLQLRQIAKNHKGDFILRWEAATA